MKNKIKFIAAGLALCIASASFAGTTQLNGGPKEHRLAKRYMMLKQSHPKAALYMKHQIQGK